MKTVRTKVLVSQIEAAIAKNQRRIKNLSEQNYELRKALEGLKALPKGTTLTKKDLEARDMEAETKAVEEPVTTAVPAAESTNQEAGTPVEGAL